MSKKVLYIIGILATLGVATYAQYKYKCTNCDEHIENLDASDSANSQLQERNGFSFSQNGVGFFCNSNFTFPMNGFKAKEPIGDSIDLGISELMKFLEKNPSKTARITGICTSGEENTSAFPNLGYARANNVKNYMVGKGIPANRLSTNGSIHDEWDSHDNTVWGPINVDFTNISSENTPNWSEIKAQLDKNSLNLQFNTGEASIDLTDEQRMMIAQLAQYLDNVKGSKITIIGHTDNVGDKTANIGLGLERAEFAKKYLVSNGVDGARIEVSSEGPNKPIADNSLESGRKLNRRTIVQIK